MKISLIHRTNQDAQLEVEDLENWEKAHGSIPEGAILIMYSASGKFYGNKTAYFGWPAGMEKDNPRDTENLHFPGINPKAADWIVANRNIYGIGVDTPSTDYGQSKDFKTHKIISAKNIWGLENLNNVEKLPSHGFTLHNMVYKGRIGSGGPSRVIAILNSPSNDSSKLGSDYCTKSFLTMITILIQFWAGNQYIQ